MNIIELDDENTALAFDTIRELRPHLTSADGQVAAVAGFRPSRTSTPDRTSTSTT